MIGGTAEEQEPSFPNAAYDNEKADIFFDGQILELRVLSTGVPARGAGR